MTTRIQLRRGNATSWTTANPVLALGEAGIETNTNLWKVGDGVTDWGNLAYMTANITSTYGDSNVATFLSNLGSNTVSTTSNITGGNVLTSGIVSATGNATAGNINTAGVVSATGNVRGANFNTTGVVSATGNITGAFFIGNGSQLTGIVSSYGNSNVATYLPTYSGNIAGGNIGVSGAVNAVGEITSFANLVTSGEVQATGNVEGGNITTVGQVSATGNVTGNFFIGNGSQLTGIVSSYGNSNVSTYLASGTNSANILTTGVLSATGNVTGNFFIGNGSQLTGVVAVSSYGNANVATYLASGTNTSNIITSGNITGGNILGNIQAADGNTSVMFNQEGFLGADAGFSYDYSANTLYVETVTIEGKNSRGEQALYVGVTGFTPLGTDVVAQLAGNADSYTQVNFQNISDSPQASGDYIITANNGTDSDNFIDMGITGNTWDGTQPNSLGTDVGVNDGYLYVNGGNLVVGTAVTSGNVNVWKFDNTGALSLSTVASESAQLVGTRKVIGGQTLSSPYSVALNAGGTPTLAYTSSIGSQSTKVTFAVQSTGAGFNWEQFDVVATQSQDTPGTANFVVSNRVKGNSTISDTVVTATINGSNQIEISLTLDAVQTNGGASSFDAVEFGLMID